MTPGKDEQHIKHLEKELKDLHEQVSSQKSMYEMTTIYLKKLQENLKVSEQKLTETNKNLIESINYAKHIQDAFIVQAKILEKLFPQSFILQKPKEIVSGDFVWAFENTNFIYLGLGDCTGHGVPGAMLSIFVISMLNQIANNFDNDTPAEILEKLDELMQKYLTRYNAQIRDSAEISLIKFDRKNQKLSFSGAKRPLVHINKKQMTIYKGAKYVLGNADRRIENVENIELFLQKNDMLYMFSDGYADQLGGEKNSKFSTKKLYTLLQEVSDLSVSRLVFVGIFSLVLFYLPIAELNFVNIFYNFNISLSYFF